MSAEIQDALSHAREALWSEYDEAAGRWHGELSSSALSTAIVVFALSRVDRERHDLLIRRGLEWIAAQQNDDGGWGDTVDSPTNITATILCWSALTLADARCGALVRAEKAAGDWLTSACGSLQREDLLRTVVAHYGDDRTFSTPILMMCALAGRLGPEKEAWGRIIQLPFEMAVLPSGLFRMLKLMVVSYALPALIAIGLVRHRKRPSRIAPLRLLRDRVTRRALAIAERMQPSNGGYEEATPLTAFVTMALVAAGEGDSPIVRRAVEFLQATVREDGSWPIDTSLATWVTVLAVTALTDGERSPAPASATGAQSGIRTAPVFAALRRGRRRRSLQHAPSMHLRCATGGSPSPATCCQNAKRSPREATCRSAAGTAVSREARTGCRPRRPCDQRAEFEAAGRSPVTDRGAAVPPEEALGMAKLGGSPAPATGDRTAEGKSENGLTDVRRQAIRKWLLAQQHDEVHPLTHEGLGGWAWSDLPGAMPDADDTSGVLVALRRLGDVDAEAVNAAERGIAWLLSIQNADGGIPTFCRGWGKLPFDRSCPDITAHTMRAFVEWRGDVAPKLRRRMTHALDQCTTYLRAAQRDDGAWGPLWFGNQHAPGLENPTYGTAQVVIALQGIREAGVGCDIAPELERRGIEWLLSAQRADGGWGGYPGGPATIEETALAIRALTGTDYCEAAARGTRWLITHTRCATSFSASPIGLYFAKLWYAEKLYPIVFTTWALEAMVRSRCRSSSAFGSS